MSKAPRITRLAFARVSDVVVDNDDHVLVTIRGRGEHGGEHEIRLRLMVGQLPWTIRKLWGGFAAWRRMQRAKIERLQCGMNGAAELGEREGDQPSGGNP
jgi:hypothetical protein